MEDILKELKELSNSLYEHDQFTWSEQVLKIREKLLIQTAKAVGHDLRVMPKIAEAAAKKCIQIFREEFLLNTQNYPREYHNVFHKKAERVIDKINKEFNSNFSA